MLAILPEKWLKIPKLNSPNTKNKTLTISQTCDIILQAQETKLMEQEYENSLHSYSLSAGVKSYEIL